MPREYTDTALMFPDQMRNLLRLAWLAAYDQAVDHEDRGHAVQTAWEAGFQAWYDQVIAPNLDYYRSAIAESIARGP